MSAQQPTNGEQSVLLPLSAPPEYSEKQQLGEGLEPLQQNGSGQPVPQAWPQGNLVSPPTKTCYNWTTNVPHLIKLLSQCWLATSARAGHGDVGPELCPYTWMYIALQSKLCTW